MCATLYHRSPAPAVDHIIYHRMTYLGTEAWLQRRMKRTTERQK